MKLLNTLALKQFTAMLSNSILPPRRPRLTRAQTQLSRKSAAIVNIVVTLRHVLGITNLVRVLLTLDVVRFRAKTSTYSGNEVEFVGA